MGHGITLVESDPVSRPSRRVSFRETVDVIRRDGDEPQSAVKDEVFQLQEAVIEQEPEKEEEKEEGDSHVEVYAEPDEQSAQDALDDYKDAELPTLNAYDLN